MRSSFANQGQICLCGSRILVQKGIYDKFRDALVAKAAKMKVGDPSLPETKMGAVVSKDHRDKILSYIEIAKEEGSKVLTGGFATSPEGVKILRTDIMFSQLSLKG